MRGAGSRAWALVLVTADEAGEAARWGSPPRARTRVGRYGPTEKDHGSDQRQRAATPASVPGEA
jgi:hypothetical protein